MMLFTEIVTIFAQASTEDTNASLFRLILALAYFAILVHLVIKRIREIGRVDYIRNFRIWLLSTLTIVLLTTIPVIVFLFYRWLGISNDPLRILATWMGGIGPLALVIGIEIGDIVIDRIRSRTKDGTKKVQHKPRRK